MNSREMESWLGRLPVLSELRGKDEQAVQEMLGSDGLTAILGLLLGSRQAFYATLSALPLGEETMRHRASVLQGKIQGIELVIQTVRELGVPVTSDGQPPSDEGAR